MHLENPRTTLKLSTTPAGQYEVDLLNRTRQAAGVDSLDKLPARNVKVLTENGRTLKVFLRGTDHSPDG